MQKNFKRFTSIICMDMEDSICTRWTISAGQFLGMSSFQFIMFQIKEYLTNIKPLEILFRKDIHVNRVYLIDKKISLN